MDLELTEEQKLLERTVREFAEAEVKPLAAEIDETGRFPRETLRKAAELGLTGISVAEKYGGAGMDHMSYAIVMEEIARVCASTSVILSVQNSLYCGTLEHSAPMSRRRNSSCPSRAAKKSAATRSPSRRPDRTPLR